MCVYVVRNNLHGNSSLPVKILGKGNMHMLSIMYEWDRLNLWGSVGRIYRNLNTREFAEEDSSGYLVPLSTDGRHEVTKCMAGGILS